MPLLWSDLIKPLHLNLKNKDTCVKTNSEVVGLEMLDDGMGARLKDGSLVEVSVVIGADGVHSNIRNMMQSLATSNGTKESSNPMNSTFYEIFSRSSNIYLAIETKVFFESRGDRVVIQCLATEDTLLFVTLKPLPERMTGRKRFSSADMEKYAVSIGEVFVCPVVKFKDVWAKVDKTTTRLLNQEEGLMS